MSLTIHVHRADFLGIFAFRPGLDGEIENLPGLELHGHGQVARADLRTLDIHHDGDVATRGQAGAADAADHLAGPVVLGVRHV